MIVFSNGGFHTGIGQAPGVGNYVAQCRDLRIPFVVTVADEPGQAAEFAGYSLADGIDNVIMASYTPIKAETQKN